MLLVFSETNPANHDMMVYNEDRSISGWITPNEKGESRKCNNTSMQLCSDIYLYLIPHKDMNIYCVMYNWIRYI